MPPTKQRTRTERLNLRTTRKQAKLIRLGAKETRSNLSNFIVESACLRAEQALASKTEFELKPVEWTQFLAALDRPIQQKPRLHKLLSERSILEGR